jgi:hypothetical protein
MDCHTPEQRRLYERGWPYLVQLVDGHKEDKKPAVSALKAHREVFGTRHVKWPRLTAAGFVRASAKVKDDEWDTPAVTKAAADCGALSDAEAEAIVAAAFAARERHGDFHTLRHVLFALEALTSTDVVLGAVVKELEGLPKKRYGAIDDENPGVIAYLSAFLLLRSDKRAAFAKRLEAVYAATVKAKAPEGEEHVRGALDLALHGNAGAARALANSHWQYWNWYLHVDDPAVHLTRLADNSKSDWVPESRILYLAGEKLLPVYTSKKALRQGSRLPNILGDFGMFAHEGVLDLMIEMIGVKGAADAPREYFQANAEWVRPRLERRARGNGANAVKAKAASSLLP